jgi:hypothetical protein
VATQLSKVRGPTDSGPLGVVFQPRRVARLVRLALHRLGLTQRGPHPLGIGRGNEVFHLQHTLRLRQIAHHQPAQADQKEANTTATSHRPRRNHFSGNRKDLLMETPDSIAACALQRRETPV